MCRKFRGGAKFACPVLSTQNQDYTFTNNRGQIILHHYRMRPMAPGAPTLKHLIIPHLAPSKRANVRFAMAITATVTAADANTTARPSHLKNFSEIQIVVALSNTHHTSCQIPKGAILVLISTPNMQTLISAHLQNLSKKCCWYHS